MCFNRMLCCSPETQTADVEKYFIETIREMKRKKKNKTMKGDKEIHKKFPKYISSYVISIQQLLRGVHINNYECDK